MSVKTDCITLARTKLGASRAWARKCRSGSTQRPSTPPCTRGCTSLPKTFSCPLTLTVFSCLSLVRSRFLCFTWCRLRRRTVCIISLLNTFLFTTLFLAFLQTYQTPRTPGWETRECCTAKFRLPTFGASGARTRISPRFIVENGWDSWNVTFARSFDRLWPPVYWMVFVTTLSESEGCICSTSGKWRRKGVATGPGEDLPVNFLVWSCP